MNSQLATAIKDAAAVPSMPQVVTRFLEVIQDPNFDYDNVVKVLSTDAGTVSEIMRLANSALFGLSRKVNSLKQALTLLGPRRTRSLVLGRFLIQALGDQEQPGFDVNYFWRRSLTSAVLASRFATKTCPRQREEVFLAALLADIGIPILLAAMPDAYRPILERRQPGGADLDNAAEIAAVGATHAEISAMVMLEWSLPEDLCDAVRHSHDDEKGAETETAIVAHLINASDRVARVLCELPRDGVSEVQALEAIHFIAITPDDLVDILGDVETEIEALAEVLRVDVIASNVYDRIAKAIADTVSAGAA